MISLLSEESHGSPESQLADIFSTVIEAKRWQEFTADKIEQVLTGIKTKFEMVCEKLTQIDNESNAFQAELAQY